MTDVEFFEMTERMEQFGGSFVIALSYAFRRADAFNRQRLLNAFPDYVEQYGPSGKFVKN